MMLEQEQVPTNAHSWYRDWFRDANYQVVYEHRDEIEADQMMDLIEGTIGSDTSRRVLDLGCGPGRHAVSFARKGYRDITGIDLSPTLLHEAAETAKSLNLDIRFLERDMRDLPDERFDLVVNLFTSFGYFFRDEDNEGVVTAVSERLTAGGWFVLDFFNSEWVRKHLVAHDERLLPDGRRLEQTRWIEGGRVEKRLLIRSVGVDELLPEATEYIESVRLYTLSDFRKMFDRAGLTLEHVFGSYEGEKFDETSASSSSRLIMFARK